MTAPARVADTMSISVSYSLTQLGTTEFMSFANSARSDVVGLDQFGFAVAAEFTDDGSSTLITYAGLGTPNGQGFSESLDPAVARLADGDVVQVGATDLGLFASIMDTSGNVLGNGAISFTDGTRTDAAGLKDGTNNVQRSSADQLHQRAIRPSRIWAT